VARVPSWFQLVQTIASIPFTWNNIVPATSRFPHSLFSGMNRSPLQRSHPRLTLALLSGLIVAVAIPHEASGITRALIGWNFSAWSYLLLMTRLVIKADMNRLHRLARQEDSNSILVLVVMSLGAVLSLVAVVAELASAKNVPDNLRLVHYILTVSTILGSWLLVGTIYSFHYAHSFYRAPPDKKPLRFPDDIVSPGYWDFLYFSFTIAVAAQTSDIAIFSSAMRKTVLAQSILSFMFNAAIIGLTINIAASAVAA
jgi:uncharacterized membrane protein